MMLPYLLLSSLLLDPTSGRYQFLKVGRFWILHKSYMDSFPGSSLNLPNCGPRIVCVMFQLRSFRTTQELALKPPLSQPSILQGMNCPSRSVRLR
jgi:hypothetical protein